MYAESVANVCARHLFGTDHITSCCSVFRVFVRKAFMRSSRGYCQDVSTQPSVVCAFYLVAGQLFALNTAVPAGVARTCVAR